MVRLGPVYKTGSIYLDEVKKEKWTNSTEKQKIYDAVTGKYPTLSVELALLAFTTFFFFFFRMSILYSDFSTLRELYPIYAYSRTGFGSILGSYTSPF
jgi:hypothetical protein